MKRGKRSSSHPRIGAHSLVFLEQGDAPLRTELSFELSLAFRVPYLESVVLRYHFAKNHTTECQN